MVSVTVLVPPVQIINVPVKAATPGLPVQHSSIHASQIPVRTVAFVHHSKGHAPSTSVSVYSAIQERTVKVLLMHVRTTHARMEEHVLQFRDHVHNLPVPVLAATRVHSVKHCKIRASLILVGMVVLV
uniref:Uncharacterized protein LOC102805711 n=1 Tax=Saccoglossus kowalevskii TaxID=10224 RepID=A0ABM0M0E2_SACKO|nr:PREDICTED: uncharacterized protein LOC102805711 [Saccoglossus kowalevskii]